MARYAAKGPDLSALHPFCRVNHANRKTVYVLIARKTLENLTLFFGGLLEAYVSNQISRLTDDVEGRDSTQTKEKSIAALRNEPTY